MAAVGCRVDQPRATVGAGQDVAAPQVAVQPRGRLGRAREVGDPLAHAPRPRARRQRSACRAPRTTSPAAQAPLRVEGRPVGGGVVGQRELADAQRRGRPVGDGAPGGGAPNAGAPAPCRAARPRPSSSSPALSRRPSSIHSSARKRGGSSSPTASTPGSATACACASHRRPAASVAYSPGAASGARLDERAPAAGELQRPRLVDRAARCALAARHRGAGGARDRVGQRARDGHVACAGRTSSSSPRHAASTRSSTRSKPLGPP